MERLISRRSSWWILFVSWTTMLTMWAAQYLAYDGNPRLNGGTPAGLAFGFIGTALIVISFLYSWRKIRLGFSLGSLRWWIEAHIYLGLLSLVFILAHSGFKFHALVPNLAFIFLVLVVLSGLIGWAVLVYLPGLNQRISDWPVQPDEVTRQLSTIYDTIADICSNNPSPFLEIYNDLIIPLYRNQVGLEAAAPDLSAFADRVEPEDEKEFERLKVLIEETRLHFSQLKMHLKFRSWLKSWLLLHIPLATGLAVFSLTHIVSIIWY